MPAADIQRELVGLFISTGRAHHEATGGINPQWAEWYADYLVKDLNGLLERDMTADDLEAWLTGADERYRAEEPDMGWPKAYASWLLEEPSQ